MKQQIIKPLVNNGDIQHWSKLTVTQFSIGDVLADNCLVIKLKISPRYPYIFQNPLSVKFSLRSISRAWGRGPINRYTYSHNLDTPIHTSWCTGGTSEETCMNIIGPCKLCTQTERIWTPILDKPRGSQSYPERTNSLLDY